MDGAQHRFRFFGVHPMAGAGDDVVKIKGRILQTFRIGLNNSQVTLDYRLAESDEVTRILSKREILENMIKENPAIGKLTQDLRLVMA